MVHLLSAVSLRTTHVAQLGGCGPTSLSLAQRFEANFVIPEV